MQVWQNKQVWQTTLRKSISLSGVGIHGGRDVALTMNPAPANSGVVFSCKNSNGNTALIRATIQRLSATELATVIGDQSGATVSTIEHLMASLYALGIDNVLVEIDNNEVPIFDGSAQPFVDAIDEAGIAVLGVPRRVIEVLRPVRINNGSQWAELLPHDGFRIDIDIEFEHEAIGRQRLILDVTSGSFRRDVAPARTFGFMSDLARLHAAGFGKGAGLNNTVVVGEHGVMNPEGLRFSDEFVRHKALDAIGDLALAGMPIKGLYRSFKGGHKLNAAMLSALMIDHTAYRVIELVPAYQPRPVFAQMPFKRAVPAYTPAR